MNTRLQKCLTIIFLFLLHAGQAQNTWTQKANFGGLARNGAVGFSIGTKGYFGTGLDNGGQKNDFWQYDPANNSWTQKANFGGAARYAAVGFSIGQKGYIGTGGYPINYNDFWEYDPLTNTWTQKANFGGGSRAWATGFSIGSKGYLGTGTGNTAFDDFWEYDPNADSWTQKTNFGGGPRHLTVGFSIGTKGYIGTGFTNSFWEYDPSVNTWTQKANFTGNNRYGAVGFSIGTKGYIGTGVDITNMNDFWEYNPFLNTWTQRLNFPGISRGAASGFSIGNKGYIGLGGPTTAPFNDFYQYAPIPSLITGTITGSPFCAGNSILINYTTTTTYNNGNTFAAQLSDAFGNFANAVTIGAITATNSGSIPCVIPANTPAGSAYRIRVISSLPIDIGTDNGANLVICSVTWPVSLSPVCSNGLPVALSGGMPAGGTYAGPGVDAFGNFDPSQVVPGVYTLSYSFNSALGCFCSAQNTMTVRALPAVTWPVSFSPVCGNASAFLLNGGLPSGGTYSGPGVDAFGNFHPSQVPFGTTTLTYTYSDAFGCTNTTTNTINIINCIDCGVCYTPDTNQIVNGDFNNGNFGFTSGLPNNCICDVGSYCVTTDSYLKCANFFHVNDHTTGTGNYLVVDGSSSNNVNVWMQPVTVTSGKSYTLSFWVHPQVSHITYNPILNVSINNVSIGIVNTALLPKQWNNLVFSWTANLNGNPLIRILQTNGSDPGNDYGIDDISFNACIPIVIANAGPDRVICEGDTVHLSGSNNLLTNNWYKINTGNPANYPFLGTGDIVVEPEINTCYLLVACDGICCDTDTVCIVVNQKPIVTWPIAYADVCQNNAPIHLIDGLPQGGIYSGQGVSGNYFDPSSVNPGSYILTYTYTDGNGCTNFTTNTITVLAPPVVLWNFSYAPVCSDLPPFALGGGMPAGGVYSGTGVDISGFFHPASVPFGLSLIYYTYTDANGCSTTVTDTIEVIHCVPCGPCYSPGPDLIVNGNFESGNTGFSSNLPVACTCTFGTYCVTTSSFNKCNANYNIPDHTSGSGNYLVIDGDQFTPNKEVWKEFVTVSNGLNYKLSFWLHPAVSNGTGRANINVIINNQVQYNIIGINVPNQWTNYTISWLSNANGSIPVSIVQTNAGGNGYDYGLDDFSFNACIPLGVNADAGPDRDICLGDSVSLTNLAGQTCDWYAINTADPGNDQYVGTGNITVAPSASICYMLICCSGLCCDTDTVCINVHLPPAVVWATSYEPKCGQSPAFQLTGGFPLGGTYSGNGIVDGYFYPSLIYIQFYNIVMTQVTYTYTDEFGCTASAINYITVYYCADCGQCFTPGADLVINGDFAAGNSGFSSDLPSSIGCVTGSYFVTTQADLKCNTFLNNRTDFPYGNGNYLVIDGDGFQPRDVWKETVNVTAGNTYVFSAWLNPALSANFPRPQLDMIINGTTLFTFFGQSLFLPWNNGHVTWQANVSGSIQIKIRQTNFGTLGIDYGLDKIEFKECIPNPLVTWPIAYATICSDQPSFQLTGGNPSGGMYSGTGVTDGYFDPAGLSPGSYLLTYAFIDTAGCSGSVTNSITVADPPVVLFDFSFAPICSDVLPFSLTGGFPAGGVYSGAGVDALGVFHPSNVPFGFNLITYTYTNSYGCSKSVTDTIEVISCVPCGVCFTPDTNEVVNGNFEAGNTGFTSDLTSACGCFYGSYCVTNLAVNKCNTFYSVPDHTSGAGNYLVIDGHALTPNKEVWKGNVTVVPGRTYKFSFWIHPVLSNDAGRPDIDVLINNQSQLSVSTLFSPSQWTNITVSWVSNMNGVIPISLMQTNAGTSGYDYGIDDISFNGCIPLGVEANAGNDTDICTGSSVYLQNFSGQTCDWYIIEPANPGNVQYAGTGNITVTPLSTTYYMLVCCNGACCDTDTVVINVHNTVVTWPGAPDTLCRISQIIQLTGGLPLGGVYSGPGVSGGYFNPQGALIGNNILTYTYTDAFGCTGIATHTIHVLTPPVVSWPVVYAPVCQPGPAVQFSGGLPVGGLYIPYGGLFHRLNSHYGINTYNYYYTDENGCSNSASNTIQFIYCIDCGPCSTPGSNQIVNGDFSAGNTGFTSDLTQSCSCNNGTYCVTINNQNKCANIINGDGDHTSGNGKYLVIEGSPLANQDVWKQNTQVILGRTYHFTFWMGSLEPFFHRPNSDFEIRFNNQVVQTIPAAQMPFLDWEPYTFSWVSNINSNSMPIVIRQVSALGDSMDYGIDDIFFNECVPNVLINAGLDDTICSGTSTQLSAVIPGPYNTITWSPANGLSCTNCLNPIASPAATTTYSLIVTTADGCTYSDQVVVTVISCAVDLNIKLFIQGFYKGGGMMTAVSSPSSLPLICDNITVELHEAFSPYAIAYTTTASILVNGDRTFSYPPGIFGNSYYIVIKHRNALETWSALPVLFNSTVINYDFSNAQNKAFGNNLAALGDGSYALFSGDVNQNGIIDYDDYDYVKDASSYFYTGYIVDDLTGDWIVESADFSVVENNIGRIIMRP